MHRAPVDWKSTVRKARELARTGSPRAIQALLPALRWRYDTARDEAVWALAEMGLRAEPDLVRVLRSAGTAVERRAAADALGRMRSTRATRPLLRALRDPNMVVRRSAMRALLELRAKIAVPRIAKLLADESGGVRVLAAHVLGAFRDRRAVNALLRSLRDRKWYVRQAAAAALGEIGDRRAASPLRAATRDKRPAVARAARDALESL